MTDETKAKKVLVTAGRSMPAVGIVHALKRVSARIDVLDSIGVAPALHSRGVVAHITHPPAPDPILYTEEVAQIAREREADLIIAPFEEGFFLSRYRDKLPVPLLVPDFKIIEQLHNKAAFMALCERLGLPVPPTRIVTSQHQLQTALGAFDTYLAKPAFGRGGTYKLTNHGSHAADLSVDDCHPTEALPWLVQAFMDGKETCILALARNGKVELLVTYEPTIAATSGFALRFTAIDEPAAVDIAEAVCAHLGYTGFIGFDYLRTTAGPVLLECNPRATGGCFLMDERTLGKALLDGLGSLTIVPPGRSKQYDSYIADGRTIDMTMPQVVRTLFSAPDALISELDVMPFIYSFVLRSKISREAYRRHVSVADIAFGDTTWDGLPLPDDTS